MAFQSFAFVFLFLPVVVIGNGLLLRSGAQTLREILLLLASLTFYSLSSWQTLHVIALSFVVNAYVCRKVARGDDQDSRRRWLILGITLDVAALAAAKYTHFAADNWHSLTGLRWVVPDFVLPLGISFFTLQQVMYLVDCYEGLAAPAPLLRHALLLSFFPYIAAGPIVRATDFFEQLSSEVGTRVHTGVARFIVGLFKKVVLADLCGKLVEPVFDGQLPPGLIDSWVAAGAFTLQLYFDFSGYSDMAVGIGEMLGLQLPQNFDVPLRSSTVIEFWTRWHITLSKFITTYLYTPIVKSLRPITFKKSMLVTLLAMTIAGLWHGAAWTFVVFGGAHGLAIVVNHVWRKHKRKRKLPVQVARALTLTFVVSTFVVFRAHSISSAAQILRAMIGLHGVGGLRGPLSAVSRPELAFCLAGLASALIVALVGPSTKTLFEHFRPTRIWALACALLAVIAFLLMNSSATKGFIYRDF